MWSAVIAVVAVAAAIYGLAVLLLYGLQGRLVFPVDLLRIEPAEVGLGEMEVVTARTRDGLDLVSWYRAPRDPGKPTLLLFHGNGESLSHRAHVARDLLDAGYGVYQVEYRGYGGNPGRPSERGLYEDGRAALDFLQGRATAVVVHGYSLGTGVAVQMAVEGRVEALILEAPYTSIAAIAARRFPFLPVRRLVRNRFENLRKIGTVAVPIVIYAGQDDLVIPCEHARMLFDTARDPKRILVVDGAGHVDAWAGGGGAFVLDFLAQLGSAISRRGS
ncbi:alpha/beta hydrolase [Inquilinus limosus]|uniref:alpha/beta hydrolase n=1 Tax=Inquilinus limosus TaxID=171674 RepID=UPI003F18C1DF